MQCLLHNILKTLYTHKEHWTWSTDTAAMTSKFNLNVDPVLYRSMIGLGKYKLNLDQPLFLSLKTGWVHIFPKVCLEPWIKCRNSKKQWYEFCSIGCNYPVLQCCQVNFPKNPNIALKKSQDSLFFF